jgi:hypothetical protein
VRAGQKYVELPEPFLPAPRQILIPLPTKTEVSIQQKTDQKYLRVKATTEQWPLSGVYSIPS